MTTAAFAYAQARLQTRHGRRPDEITWQRLAAIPDHATLLTELRRSPLAPWVHNLTPDQGVHEIETTLQNQFRQEVTLIAHWLPEPWRKAVAWVAWLPVLPALHYLDQGHPPLPWMRRDPFLKSLLTPHPENREAGSGQPLLAAKRQGIPLVTAWSNHWRELWPEPQPALQTMITQAHRLLNPHDPASQNPAANEWDEPLALARAGLRRYALQPAAAFYYLILIAWDLRRLRGHLVQRLLLPTTTPGPVAGATP